MPWLTTRKWNGAGYDPEPIIRWVNDFPRNRLLLSTLPGVLADYNAARHKGYSMNDAAAYAMARKESCWHSGNNVAFKDKARDNRWWHTARINKEYTLNRFRRVLGNSLSLGKSLSMDVLESVVELPLAEGDMPHIVHERCEPYQQWVGNHFNMDSPRGKEAIRLHDAYARVACHPLAISPYTLLTSRQVLRPWKSIKKGRELFIKGWGPFNICELGLDIRAQERVPSPHDFTAWGYGITTHALEELLGDEWLMQYITRWITWWRAPVPNDELLRLPRMDEVIRAKQADTWYEQYGMPMYGPTGLIRDMSTHPQCVLNVMTELHERLHQRQHQQNLEWEAKHNVPIDESWPWVTEAMDEVHTNEGTLVPISTQADLQRIGSELNNCAGGYAREVQTKHCMLVKLVKDDRCVALGEFSHTGELRQCSGHSNRKVSKEIRKVFENCKPRWQDK